MTESGEQSVAENAAPAGRLADGTLDRAGRAANRVLVRWLVEADLPLRSSLILVTLDPDDAPMSAGEVAEASGMSVDDATRALHELRSLGYASERHRRYEPTEKGMRLHASLTAARRRALKAFFSELRVEERHDLMEALRPQAAR
jgi:DNA-binding MarR family transcriptional regulator